MNRFLDPSPLCSGGSFSMYDDFGRTRPRPVAKFLATTAEDETREYRKAGSPQLFLFIIKFKLYKRKAVI
jgi:hypothetical protein